MMPILQVGVLLTDGESVMAIARVFEARGWTVGEYDELIERLVTQLGLEPGGSAPGVLFHWAAATDTGVRAVDVYASREDADRLAAESIGPIAADLGLAPPEITEVDVHRYLRASTP
jgi:hypothetical protein